MDEEVYFFNLPQVQYGQTNATLREIALAPGKFFQVCSFLSKIKGELKTNSIQTGDIAWMMVASMLVCHKD
jgi:hypothetical protein